MRVQRVFTSQIECVHILGFIYPLVLILSRWRHNNRFGMCTPLDKAQPLPTCWLQEFLEAPQTVIRVGSWVKPIRPGPKPPTRIPFAERWAFLSGTVLSLSAHIALGPNCYMGSLDCLYRLGLCRRPKTLDPQWIVIFWALPTQSNPSVVGFGPLQLAQFIFQVLNDISNF